MTKAFLKQCINMQNGSKMMADLSCAYAMNLDGGPSRQMRVASAYRNGTLLLKVTR